jgi:hypothetical protein
MKPARSIATGLLAGPVIVMGVLAGAAQAAHATTPVGQAAYSSHDHAGPGWRHDHHNPDPRWGDHRDPRWDPRRGNRFDPRWGYYRHDPRWGNYRYDPRLGRYHWDHR